METTTVPKASPEALPELAAFLAPFAPLFRRSTSRQSLERYVTGLLTDLPRKNADAIAAAVANTSTERLQHPLTDAGWDAAALDQQRVATLTPVSPAGGILVRDDTGLPKQGKASVGVARQDSGTLGKVGNCQIAVTCCDTDPQATWPVAVRLSLPQAWAEDLERRGKARVPSAVTFQSKPEMALALLDQ